MESIHKTTTIGSYGTIEIELFCSMSKRNFDDVDKSLANDLCRVFSNSLAKRTISLDPKVKEEIINEKKGILSLFSDNYIFVEEIHNEYSHDPCFPWFLVTTSKGHIKIGWRKRVINIDWSKTKIEENAGELFPNEDVTKGEKYIHAYGYEKAKEYLNVLLND